jgi:hypothetical protein
MNGFFSPEAMEALQQAYEMQLTPEQQDIDAVSGLPTNVVSNTSPWHGTVEMWKYPDGLNKREHGDILYTAQDDDLEEESDEEEEEFDTEYEEDVTESEMTEEEVDALIQELLESDDED